MTTPEIVIMTDADIDRLSTTDDKGFGALMTPEGPLPLKSLDVHASIEGLIAETGLTQTFVNTHKEPLEATYIFPLPDRAAVTRFRLEVAGRVVEGVLKERADAASTRQRLSPGIAPPSPRKNDPVFSRCASATCRPARQRSSV
jgi:Ca-activated chloride channel family protein